MATRKKIPLTRTALATVSVLALSAVAYGCSSGISQSEADRQADEKVAAAEAAAKAAAEAAAKAAAEAAAKAAEEAAAAAKAAAEKAEADKEAAVEAARLAAIAEQEKKTVGEAITAAEEAVDALTEESSDVDVAGAMGAISKASAAIAAATSFSEADMAAYNAKVTAIQADLALVRANIRGHRAEVERDQAQDDATAPQRASAAVQSAITDLAEASAAEATASAAYTDAATALAAAQQAVADADADSLAAASAALAEALLTASTAAADLGVKTQAVADATAALTAAQATLAEVDPDHVALQQATAALEQAEEAQETLTQKVAELQQQINDLIAKQEAADKARQEAAAKKAAEEAAKAATAKGKALHAALGADPLAHLGDADDVAADDQRAVLATTGLTVDQVQGTLAADPDAVELKAVEDSEGTLGDWNSMSYSLTDTGTKITNDAMVYTNQDDPTRKAFAAGATQADADGGALVPVTDTPDADWEYNSSSGTLFLPALAATTAVKGDGFPTAGSQTFTPDGTTNAVVIRGTYQGASGNYRCTGIACSAGLEPAGISLSAGWVFVHDSGAMVSIPDTAYLYFGWWLRSDKDGPTHASAFTGKVGVIAPADDGTETPLALGAITTGSATYTGAAAGKFAINDPLNGGDAGHFTADATLTAKFGTAAGAGVTGTINNFRLNDGSEDAGWSVALNNNTVVSAAAAAVPLTAATDPEPDDARAGSNLNAAGVITPSQDLGWTVGVESLTTVWSIDGNAAAASGTWSGQMYDEARLPAAADDGSNVPTSVTGVFHSEFGSTHTMVGAFGAEAD